MRRPGGPLGGRAATVFAIGDQGLASAGNIALLVLVARQSTVTEFAAFSLAYIVHTIVLGLVAAYVGQPLVLVRDPADGVLGRACARALVFTAVGTAVLGAALATGLLTSSEIWRTLGALGVVMPVMLTQEVARYCFAALRLPHLAFVTDLVKVVGLVTVLTAVAGADAPGTVLAWGVATVPALVLSLLLLRRHLLRPGAVLRPMVARDHLGRRFAIEFAVGNGASQLSVLGIGAFASPLAVGALRGASTLFGPLNVLFTASTSFGPPFVGRMPTPRRQVGAAARIGAALAAVAAAWALVIALLPASVGEEVLGDTWASAHALVPATGTQYVAMAFGSAAVLALRVVQPRATLPIQLIFSAVNVVTVVGGFLLAGTLGAAWGLTLGSALKAGALWHRALRHRDDPPTAPPRR